MTESTKFAIRLQKNSIQKRLKVLITMLVMTSAGMIWMTNQMPEGHMNKIFANASTTDISAHTL